MYNLNHIIVIIFNCIHAYAWRYTIIKKIFKTHDANCTSIVESNKIFTQFGYNLNTHKIFTYIVRQTNGIGRKNQSKSLFFKFYFRERICYIQGKVAAIEK